LRSLFLLKEYVEIGRVDLAEDVYANMVELSGYSDGNLANNFYENVFMLLRDPDAERALTIIIEELQI